VLTIKVVEARNLAVKTGTEKPYVLLQYDRTDSVSREFGALPRRDSVAGLTNSAKKKKKGFHAAVPSCKTGMEPSKTVTTVRRVGSMGKKEETDRGDVFVGETEAEQIARLNLNQGTVDAPVWNHVAQLYVPYRSFT
jgi:protein-serine/threonine kinase